MKTSYFLLMTVLSILPLAFSAAAASSLHTRDTTAAGAPVLTVRGRNVVVNDYYFLSPADRGANTGGGIILTSSNSNNSICPFYVAQHLQPLTAGFPFNFLPLRRPYNLILTDTPLYIAAENWLLQPSCSRPTVWTVTDRLDGSFVISTGPPQIAVADTLWYFIIVEVGNRNPKAYKFRYCMDCLNCVPDPVTTCNDVGVREIGGERLLVLDDENPLVINFVENIQNAQV